MTKHSEVLQKGGVLKPREKSVEADDASTHTAVLRPQKKVKACK
jgi:hypothetical protein